MPEDATLKRLEQLYVNAACWREQDRLDLARERAKHYITEHAGAKAIAKAAIAYANAEKVARQVFADALRGEGP